ncbi:hypothetical protein UFOVP388_22 [uncultured Caudovirales phage]|uniref:Uncharacterized protein n=1 Tax=uncultured Caudovirales phage TaxID=2100421 RepID=A0A6J7X0M4_9CAUD|nr:hypothetical protein UFOVP388_22 [uncultured Caudovirales phage]
MLEVQNEIKELKKIAKIENVSMSFVLNVKKYLEQKRSNELFINANVIIDGYPTALEKIAIILENK